MRSVSYVYSDELIAQCNKIPVLKKRVRIIGFLFEWFLFQCS